MIVIPELERVAAGLEYSYEIVARLNSQTHDYHLTAFITCIELVGLKICNSLPFANNAEKRDMAMALELTKALLLWRN